MQGTVKNRSENPVRHSGAGRKPVVDVIAKRLSGVVAISYLYIHLFGRSLFDSTVPLTVLLWRRCRKATEEDKNKKCRERLQTVPKTLFVIPAQAGNQE